MRAVSKRMIRLRFPRRFRPSTALSPREKVVDKFPIFGGAEFTETRIAEAKNARNFTQTRGRGDETHLWSFDGVIKRAAKYRRRQRRVGELDLRGRGSYRG